MWPFKQQQRQPAPASVPTPQPAQGSQATPRVGATVADGIKTSFAVFVGGFCPFAILVILTISAGFYFNVRTVSLVSAW